MPTIRNRSNKGTSGTDNHAAPNSPLLLLATRRPATRRFAVCRWVCAGLLVTAVACASGESEQDGAGGQAGSNNGGTTSSGGSAGGSTTQGAGGSKASGGSSAGGTSGTGGSISSGGTGTGGAASGGSSGKGGASSGGASGSGGIQTTAGTGGTNASGGRGGRDGGSGSGGATNTGGAVGGTAGTGTGGNQSTGGMTGTGGDRPDGGSPDGSPDSTGSTFMPCPTTPGTACVILPLGDSITEGCCTAPMGGYRIELFRQALKDGKNITFVGSLSNGPSTVDGTTFPKKHEGHGGYTIDTMSGKNGISGQITDQALANYHPHIVLLKIGTNDINGNVDIANAPTRLGKLMDEIITGAPSALLVVSAIIPTTNDGTNQRVRTYNAAIPGLVDARAKAGKHVVFLDNYEAFAQNSSYKTALMADGLHPNTAGYAVLGQSFYDTISALLPAGP
jgi:lysophospholipase L1-like esterase